MNRNMSATGLFGSYENLLQAWGGVQPGGSVSDLTQLNAMLEQQQNAQNGQSSSGAPPGAPTQAAAQGQYFFLSPTGQLGMPMVGSFGNLVQLESDAAGQRQQQVHVPQPQVYHQQQPEDGEEAGLGKRKRSKGGGGTEKVVTTKPSVKGRPAPAAIQRENGASPLPLNPGGSLERQQQAMGILPEQAAMYTAAGMVPFYPNAGTPGFRFQDPSMMAGVKSPVAGGQVPVAAQGDNPDPKRSKRMLSNRESARRSRQRKQVHLNDLERELESAQQEIARLKESLKVAKRQIKTLQDEAEQRGGASPGGIKPDEEHET